MKAIESKMLDVQCAGSLTVEVDPGKCYATVPNIPLPEIGKTDISYVLTGATTSATNGNTEDASGNEFNIGITRVTYNFDGGSCYFTIIVLPPIVFPTAAQERDNTPGNCFYVVDRDEFDPYIDQMYMQCAEMSSFNYKYSIESENGTTLAGKELSIGIHNITWTFYFGNSLVATKVITVNVVDNEGFGVIGYSDEFETIAGCSTNLSYTFDATNICPDVMVLKYTLSGATHTSEKTINSLPNTIVSLTFSESFNVGKTDVDFIISDAAKNVQARFSVTVLPEFTLPAGPINKTTPADQCSYTVNGRELDPALSCNSTIEGFSITNDFNNKATLDGAKLPVGTRTITWTSVYGKQVAQTKQIIVVVEDKTAPVIANCPTPTTTYTDQCFAALDFPLTVTDNCSVTIAYVLTGATTSSGTGEITDVSFNIGTTIVTYTVTDGSNTTQCTFPVTVLPNIIMPQSTTKNNSNGKCGYLVSGTEFSPTFGCASLPATYTYSCELNGNPVSTLNQVLLPIGNNEIKWIFKLDDTIIQEELFSITVIDNEAPVITCPTVTYPNGLSYFPTNSATNCAYYGSFAAPAVSDNCTPAQQLTVSYVITNGVTSTPPGSGDIVNYPFPVGVNKVTYTVTDLSGNQSVCSYSVEVKDGNAPVITCPSVGYPSGTAFFPTDPDKCTAKRRYNAPVATDNCTPAEQLVKTYRIVTANSIETSTGDIDFDFPVGTNTVTYTVTDIAGNAATCTFDVIVQDIQLPEAICMQGDIIVTLDKLLGHASISASTINNGSRDNCGITSMSLSKYDFDCSNIGDVPVTLTVEDASGNQASCTTTVTVQYDPSLNPQIAFREKEICSDGYAVLELTNTGFETVTQWDWTVDVPAGITPATVPNGTATGDYTINQAFGNTTNAAAQVTYTVTPKLYNLCAIGAIEQKIWVNPQPALLALKDTSICNNTFTKKIVRSNTIGSPNAEVFYSWVVADNPSVDGEADFTSGQSIGTLLDQQLNNRTANSQKVVYTLTPSLRLLGHVCSYAGTDRQTEITIEPTPIIAVKLGNDTVCNNTKVLFEVDSLNWPAGRWQYTLSTNIPLNDNVIPDVNNRVGEQDDSFQQTVNNQATIWHQMEYKFSPRIITRQGSTCHAPARNDTLVNLRVNPTPLMNITNFQDSICFKDDGPEIHMTSNNGEVLGDLKYHLWKVDYAGNTVVENVVAPGAVGFTGRAAAIDQTTLWNKSDTVQTVTYYIYPFIEYRNTLHCSGDSLEQKIYLASEVVFDMVADTVYGGVHNISCFGASDGVIEVMGQKGGWSAKGYDYEWTGYTDAGNTPIITGRPASISPYGVTVSDRVIGCQTYKEVILTQPEKLELLSPNIGRPDCNGPTGSIVVHATGGTRTNRYPYEYECFLKDAPALYYYSGEDSSYTSLKSGTYVVTVVDTNKCVASMEYNVPYTNGDTILYPNWNKSTFGPNVKGDFYNVSCYGARDGSMNPNPNHSSPFFSAYTWKYNNVVFKKDSIKPGDPYFVYAPSGGKFQVTGLDTGYYDLILVDDRGCTFATERQLLTQPPKITFNPSVSNYANNYQVKCDGAKDGHIIISNTAGGYGEPYRYDWSTPDGDPADLVPGASQQTALGAGKYTLRISNGLANCDTITTFTLDAPPKLNVQDTVSKYNNYEVQCYGDHSGKIRLMVSGGGEGANTYQWSTSDGSGLAPQNKDQEALSAGTYVVDIGYSGGLCTLSKQYKLRSPSRMQNDSIVSGIKCFGGTDASIITNVSGGIPAYSYRWMSPDVTLASPNAKDQSGLAPGTYWLVITDNNGCIKMETYDLKEPEQVTANLDAVDMSCDPGNDGTITTNPKGGTGNTYRFEWSNGQTTPTITGLTVGDYTVTVTDINGCTGMETASIDVPSPLIVTATAASNFNRYQIDCHGNHTGKINLIVQNGRGALQYQWLSGNVSNGLEHLAAGTYSVEVTDQFNCKGSASITLTEPNPLNGQFAVNTITCPGGNNGSLHALVGGGVLPYSYHWSNGATDTLVAGNLAAGEYTVRVTDSNNCFYDLQTTLTQPPVFKIDFLPTEAFCPETSDGSIKAVVSGGTPPYLYLWTGVSGATAPGITDVRSGTYTLEITDAVNCKYSKAFELGYNSEGCLRIPNAFSPNNDGSNDRWEITVGDPHSSVRYPLHDIYPDAIVEVYAANWGIRLFRSQKGYPEPWDGKYRGKYLPLNSYVYIIKLNSQSKPITGNVAIIR